MKRCKTCQQEKPAEAFYRNKTLRDGLESSCAACVKARTREWYWANVEWAKERERQRYHANPEINKRQAKAWAQANPERRRQIRLASAGRHRAEREAYNKRRLAAMPSEERRLRGVLAAARRRQRARCADGYVSRDEAQAILERARGRCHYCGLSRKLTLDHVLALVNGGTNSADNLIPCCGSCNSRKGTKDVADWLEQTYGIVGMARALYFLAPEDASPGAFEALFQEVEA